MRLLHVVLTPRFSGAEILVKHLCQVHSLLGHQCTVASLEPAESSFKAVMTQQSRRGIQWLCPERRLTRLERLAHLNAAIRQYRPDAIFAHSVIPAAYARAVTDQAVVVVLHSADQDDYRALPLRLSEYGLRHRARAVIAVAPRAAENYQRRFNKTDVFVIPNGIDRKPIAEAEAVRQGLRREWGFNEDHRLVLQIGRIARTKGQIHSVRALVQVLRKEPSTRLLLAGIIEDLEYRRIVEQQAAALGITQNIEFLGPRDDVPSLLAISDVVVMPSSIEAHSVAFLETLASGAPVVASDIPPFAFARLWPGVRLIQAPSASDEFSAAIIAALATPSRHDRDLAEFDIEQTAARYLDVLSSTAKQVLVRT